MKTLSIVMLAAGFSRRFGSNDKLLAKLTKDRDEQTVLGSSLSSFDQKSFKEKILVVNDTRHPASAIGTEKGWTIVENKRASIGMGSSLAAGVNAIATCDGLMIALADMPFIQTDTVEFLISCFHNAPKDTIVAPAYHEKRGHPVIFPSFFFSMLMKLKSDQGARQIIDASMDQLTLAPVNDRGVCRDIDSREDLAWD
ncbi:MAG: nucleotidyltransferase family protein [Pseudomonadota bacterium]